MKVQLTESVSVTISVMELANDIYQHAKYLRASFTEEELHEPGTDFSGTDCRLRVYDGCWQLKTGDSQFDDDHRGYWSTNSIPYRCTREESREIAKSLIEELG